MRLLLFQRSIFLGVIALPLAAVSAGTRVDPPPAAFSQFTVELPERDVHNSMRGKVVDPTGAAVGGALVEIVDTETQKAVASQTTEQSGQFHFEALPLGHHYMLAVRKNSFCPLEVPLNILQHGGARHLKLKLVVAT
jgi:hypothetical protein